MPTLCGSCGARPWGLARLSCVWRCIPRVSGCWTTTVTCLPTRAGQSCWRRKKRSPCGAAPKPGRTTCSLSGLRENARLRACGPGEKSRATASCSYLTRRRSEGACLGKPGRNCWRSSGAQWCARAGPVGVAGDIPLCRRKSCGNTLRASMLVRTWCWRALGRRSFST